MRGDSKHAMSREKAPNTNGNTASANATAKPNTTIPVLRQKNGGDVPRLALSKAEVAASFGCSVDFVEDHIWSSLRIVRRGRLSFVPVCELERWLESEASHV